VVIPTGYQSFPDMAMKRFDQERGERLNEKRIVIPKDEDLTLPTRQAMSVPAPKTISVHIPSKELAARKAEEEEIVKKELARIKAEQEEEKRRQPTSLAGAIREMNIQNAPVKKLAVVSRVPQGAQQRLRDRKVSHSSVEFLGEVKKVPERGGERGTTSRTTARASSPTIAKAPPILTDSAEESDNEAMEQIRKQRCLVKMEVFVYPDAPDDL